MKKYLFIMMCTLLLSIVSSCRVAEERGYIINNLSNDTLCVYFATGFYDFGPTAYPDTMLPEDRIVDGTRNSRLSERIHNSYVEPHTEMHFFPYLLWDDGMPEIDPLPRDTFSVFIINKDTLKQYGWDYVRINNKILVRYDLSVSEVKRMNSIFPYPPQEFMRDMKMWPPYSYFEENRHYNP